MYSRSLRLCPAMISLALAAQCFAADQHVLRVCADPNNLPFSNERGEGLENELARIVSRDLARLTLSVIARDPPLPVAGRGLR